MTYPLATSSWDEDEKIAARTIIDSGMCTMGPITKEFETEFAQKMGSRYAVFVNSGSSANLIAITALLYKQENPLKPGDEIIVPAVSWATSYYPIHQCGLKLIFVDVEKETLNISPEKIKSAITPKTKAILAVNILGMPCNFDEIVRICRDYNLLLIEDNCESLGATFNKKQCGTFGVIGTYSSFFSHHMCTVEGGFCVTDDEELYQIMVSLRAHGWIRNLPENNLLHNKTGKYMDDTWKFVLPGYNVRPNDIFSAIGIQQLKKLDSFILHRINNAILFQNLLSFIPISKHITIQKEPDTRFSSSWFGFSMICDSTQLREKVIDLFEKSRIEYRPIVAGNFTKNPVMKHLNYEIRGSLANSDLIDANGLFVGNNGCDMAENIKLLIETLSKIS